MVKSLELLYKSNFSIEIDNLKLEYLNKIVDFLSEKYSKEELYFLDKVIMRSYDIELVDFFLKKKNKDNIVSYCLLLMSSLNESLLDTQNLYVNKYDLNKLQLVGFFSKIVFNLIKFYIRRNKVIKIINEYPNV